MSDEHTEKKVRDFAEQIPAATWERWIKLKRKHPRITRQKHIVAFTGKSKPVITRAMVDCMATVETRELIDKFFNELK